MSLTSATARLSIRIGFLCAAMSVRSHQCTQTKGKSVCHVDANLSHDTLTGKSFTACLNLVNVAPINWNSKKQSMMETATHSSEFVAARTCIEQTTHLSTTLQCLGVQINKKSHMFGDNKAVVKSSSMAHSKLHKQHNVLSSIKFQKAISSQQTDFMCML